MIRLLIKYSLLITFIILFSACERLSIQPSEVCTPDTSFAINEAHPKSAQIQALMDKYIAKGLPGMTILINDDDGFWYASAGYADIENGIEMQPCHINKLGSITKMMMGALVWQLVQDGTLKIDDPISKYIPEVAAKVTNGDDITLAMLINHTAGVYDVARDLNYNLAVINGMARSWTAEEVASYFEGKPANNLPGEAARYSNSHTLLVSMVVDAATGRDHADLLKERFFDPLGMNNTVYYDYESDFPLPNLAQGYLDFNNDGGDIQNISNLNPGNGNGFTGVYSTVTDLYRFMNALLREKILTTAENLDLILGNFRYVGDGHFGYSIAGIHDENRDLFEENVHAYGHGGGDIGFSANLNYFPHNNTIFAATYNYGTNLGSGLGGELSKLRDELFLLMAE